MLPLGVAGLLIYLLMRAGNDAAPNPDGMAEWRSCPTWLHGLLRDDARPVLATAAMVELAGLVMAATAVLVYVEILPPPIGAYLIVAAWGLALASFIAVEWRARSRV